MVIIPIFLRTFAAEMLAAAVGYAIRFVFCSSTVAVFFLTLCFLDRTLANLQGVLLDGRHPFQFFPILAKLERIIYIGRSPLSIIFQTYYPKKMRKL